MIDRISNRCRAALLTSVAFAWLSWLAPTTAATPLPEPDITQVPIGNRASALPEGWQHGAFMEIFVRGFRDSDGDGIGDLRGLIASLDYLRDLGIKGLWLMPIHPSQDGDHGYSVTDYRAINPAYGTLADFDQLLRAAHARGIGVIIDYVINHSAANNPLFLNSAASPASPYRDWYVWRDPKPNGWRIFDGDPWRMTSNGAYFAGFSDHMPDFNLRNTAVIDYHMSNLRFWLNRGVDGFRFDAVGNLIENGPTAWENQPENLRLMGRLREVVAAFRNRFVVCEGPEHSYMGYAAPQACGSAFAFIHNRAIVEAARGEPEAVRKVADFFKSAPMTMATLVSSHDSYSGGRLWDQVQGNEIQYRLAAATYLLMPGSPFIYYGEEIGMAGARGLKGDPELRGPMSWSADPTHAGFSSARPFRPLATNAATNNVAAQLTDPASLLSFYRAIVNLRNRLPSIARGSFEAVAVDRQVMSFQRRLGGEHTVVAINYGGTASSVDIEGLPAAARLSAAYPADRASVPVDAKGTARLALAPQSAQVFVVTR